MRPLVSIVTPSYNQAQFLRDTIQSVIGQDYPRLEYLIVDGGSTDGSIDIIKSYADRLTWWISEQDNGQANAINKGLQRANGDFVAWLNSDDQYLPGVISQVVREFAKYPDISLLYADVQAVDEKGIVINHIKYGDWGLDGLLTFRIIGQPAVFLRRSALEKVGYLDESLHFLMDHQLWLRVARVSRIKYITKTWAVARFHGGAKNVMSGDEMSREAYQIVAWMRDNEDFSNLLAACKGKIMAGAHRLHAYYLLEGGRAGEALCYYGRSFLAHPGPAARDWKRIVYAMLKLVGLGGVRSIFMNWRRNRMNVLKR